ncbi:MAG: LytTR family DNA-binding domain-containing protein [Bacteroidota bacterium]
MILPTQLSAIILDDEKYAITNLRNLIRSYCPHIKVIDTAGSAESAVLKINALQPDVVFLDVNMPGNDGFSILPKLTNLPFLVFVTAHQQHALRALKVNAVDFLLKPIDINELTATEQKLLQLRLLKNELSDGYGKAIGNLFTMLSKPESVTKIALHSTSGYEVFDIHNILYLSGDDNYTVFHIDQQKERVVSKTLKEYDEMLHDNQFMRIHKSTLINLTHVKKIMRTENMEVEMQNGAVLSVSRRKMKDLIAWAKTVSL